MTLPKIRNTEHLIRKIKQVLFRSFIWMLFELGKIACFQKCIFSAKKMFILFYIFYLDGEILFWYF